MRVGADGGAMAAGLNRLVAEGLRRLVDDAVDQMWLRQEVALVDTSPSTIGR